MATARGSCRAASIVASPKALRAASPAELARYDMAEPIKVLKGTKFLVDVHFDNSASKRGNPDATADVYGGTQILER